MRDSLMGGLTATILAAPLVIVCCGGGGVVLSALAGAAGGWLSGFGVISIGLAASALALVWRSVCRNRQANQGSAWSHDSGRSNHD
ncbi:hypothetical protein [Phaeobacter gallaeciensis]|uniref:hypothetical protein n=1 Tax=Phaeobacter gallaeciensis TaxID=60890 RepID=UPI00237FD022|nr:hypothetical protein [Phaeobacter gallaeciensis]MDE4099711.1 hypothetical protein [Phaeobacter gallaeciensis]MDE4108554.1 hypothetical protein [Phaeobacter gallaeciensis]MDE4110430.1 hypothetical protein [Phaeobacter gallaeciensis]MDE4117352.1 hypothetical protein [Phaeobacter gallaeciensis]MDE4121825.1 hypothetical protein [Phaeobacter gallaeciensis]